MTVCGWINRRQLVVIEYLREENRVLREQLGPKRPKFTDAQRIRLARKGKALSRKLLNELCIIVTPDALLRWYRRSSPASTTASPSAAQGGHERLQISASPFCAWRARTQAGDTHVSSAP